MIDKLERIKQRYLEVTRMLSDPAVIANQEKNRELGKEFRELTDIVKAYDEYKGVYDIIQGSREILEIGGDAELKQLAEAEIAELQPRFIILEDRLKQLLVPKDPNDDKNILLEIRAGTGGEEAALFASDLYRMYTRYAERHGWKVETLDWNETAKGGFKEIVVSLIGEDVYGTMKFESGVHRVQRVPETEAQGRVHTSAASVVVLPEVEDVEIDINPADLQLDTYRSGG